MAERIVFVASDLPDGSERIELRERRDAGFFRKASSHVISRADWIRKAPRSGMAALSRLRSLPGGDAIEEDDGGITVPPQLISSLSELEAQALGLPPATNLTLQLRSTGSLHEGTIAVGKRWMRRGGVPVRAKDAGARIRETGKVARLPEPLFSTLASLRRLEQAEPGDARRAAFAELREKLEDIGDAVIEADGTISRLRIAYASNFSLDLRTHGGLFDFDPVLFSRTVAETVDGDLIDAAESSLLTEHEQQRFRSRFRQQKGGRRSYLLSDGTILYLDPNLGRVLDVVREKQAAPAEERRSFARSPQKYIREELNLDEAGDDEAADRLFIETQQYSERVAGIEEWQKPVLPWIKPAPTSWLPEKFGLRVGEEPDVRHIELEPGEARQVEKAIDDAIDQGKETASFRNEEIPATAEAKNAAKNIADLEDEIAKAAAGLDAESEEEPKLELPTYFLKVGENFEELDYARLVDRAAAEQTFAPPSIPSGVRSTPKAHQTEGFAWLTEAWARKVPGLLLADDMGLGKTFQALTFLAWLRTEAAPGKPVLIVAPTGLLRNWRAEIELHLERDALGQIVEVFGANLKHLREGRGNDIRGGTSKLDVSRWQDAGVVLTTFETMRDYHMSFARVPFSAIVYDEIQKLKNPASQMTRAAKTLNSQIQIGMTGTPVENRLQDLWSIADVVYPGLLGTSREFETAYSSDSVEALQELQTLIIERDGNLPPFMLRRMKEGLLSGLPEKRVQTYEVTMPEEQVTAYDQVLARARALRQSGNKGAMLKILHMLRGTSLHPQPPVGLSEFDGYIASSARLQKTFELLEGIAEKNEKALIFCEDLDMQSFLAIAIQERFELTRRVSIINGSVAGPKRQAIVTDFQSRPAGFDVMILSPKAGGVGLTITAANHVIHLSRWWNPAVEDQATDRVYRIGQDKAVTVHIPMAVHPDEVIGPSSFDVRLNRLMERKRELSRSLLVPPESGADLDEMMSAVLDGEEVSKPGGGRPAQPETPSIPQRKGRHIEPQGLSGGEAVREEKPSRERPILSVRPTPVDVAQSRSAGIRRVVFEVGGPRDWEIFTQHIENVAIEDLQITDPYCCADEGARRRVVDFVARFARSASSINRVHVTSFDAESLQNCWESSQEQRADLQARLAQKLPNLQVRHIQRSRRSSGDLHDRSVIAVLADGGQAIWDLGRGIDGVMTARFDCVVNALHEEAASRRH